MKKTFIYLTLAVSTAILVNTCAKPLEEGLESQGGEACIELSVACAASSTRATEPGEETYNENKITHIDWFVFRSDAGTATAIEHGRETYTDKDNVTESFTVKSINMQKYVVSNACSGYVYVIANLPDEYSHDETSGIKHTEGSTTVTDGLTLGALKALTVTTTFDLVDTDGNFQAQDKFVMASELIPFSLTASEKQQTVEAKLSRVASKITLELDIISAIDEVVAHMAARDTLYEEYKQTWYPAVNRIQIYLSYANSQTTLDKTLFGETPETYTDANFFTYTRTSFNPTVASQTDGWKLTGTPFYSYPMSWNTQDEHAPFIKIILPWRAYVEEPTYETAHFIDHENPDSYHEGNKLVSAGREHISDETASAQEFFYKVSIPADNNILQSNTWYKISMDVAILGGRADDMSMEMAGKYYVADWIDTDIPAGGAMVQGSYLKLASDTYYIYGGNSIEIPVKSSHDITTTVTSVRWLDYSTQTPTTRSSNSPSSYSYLVKKPTTTNHGSTSFTFTHELMTDIASATSSNKPDVSEYTFTVQVRNAAGVTKDITIIQRPPLMIVNEKNTHSQRGYVFVNNNTSNNNNWNSVNGSLGSGGDNNNPNMYIISSSIVPSGYILADPRSSTVDNINGGGWANNGYRLDTQGNGKLTNYHPTLTDELGKTKIAPKIRIASSFGKTRPGTFTEMQQRCASYQEFGYPAGRWRVPTKAEIEFMITLSNANVIPSLFTASNFSESHQTGSILFIPTYTTHSPNYYDGGYYSADGGVLYPFKDGNQNLLYYLSAEELATHNSYDVTNGEYARGTNWVRCVYDEWYWGSDKISNSDTFTWGDIAY